MFAWFLFQSTMQLGTYAAILTTNVLLAGICILLAIICLPFQGMTACMISYPSFAVKNQVQPLI